MSQFHFHLGSPYIHTLNKGSLSLPLPRYPCPFFPFPPLPPNSVNQSTDCFTPFSFLPHAPGQGNIIALARGRSPSVDANTHIPEDRPRGPYTLVSFTSLMGSLDHLRGVLSASWDGCFSHARLKLHHCIIEIRTEFVPHSTWSKTPDVTRL